MRIQAPGWAFPPATADQRRTREIPYHHGATSIGTTSLPESLRSSALEHHVQEHAQEAEHYCPNNPGGYESRIRALQRRHKIRSKEIDDQAATEGEAHHHPHDVRSTAL